MFKYYDFETNDSFSAKSMSMINWKKNWLSIFCLQIYECTQPNFGYTQSEDRTVPICCIVHGIITVFRIVTAQKTYDEAYTLVSVRLRPKCYWVHSFQSMQFLEEFSLRDQLG